jgi:hypothetical protein
VANGDVTLATRDVDDLPDPLQAHPERELPSARLARLRANER